MNQVWLGLVYFNYQISAKFNQFCILWVFRAKISLIFVLFIFLIQTVIGLDQVSEQKILSL